MIPARSRQDAFIWNNCKLKIKKSVNGFKTTHRRNGERESGETDGGVRMKGGRRGKWEERRRKRWTKGKR